MNVDHADSGAEPSKRIVEQRIRNRVIEYLELAASFEDQKEYARATPIAHVPYEVIGQWRDWVSKDPRVDADPPGIYSASEIEALQRYESLWEAACQAVPDDYPSLEKVQSLPEWDRLRQSAKAALIVFAERGRLPEDHEVA